MDPKYQVTNKKVYRYTTAVLLKGAKETISLAQAKYAVPGPNRMLKSLWR